MATSQTLLDLVPEHLKPLAPLEEKLLEGAPLGREVSDFEPGEPIDKTRIGEAQRVRIELLAWLLTDPGGRAMIHYKGIHLRGAQVVGGLDLSDAAIGYPIRLQECLIEESMVLDRGEYKLLDFSGSQVHSISANSVRVLKDVILKDGFTAKGEVRLLGADIGGSLECGGGEFENPGGYALSGDGLTTRGEVFLGDGFKSKGEVSLLGADIGGSLGGSGGEFENAVAVKS